MAQLWHIIQAGGFVMYPLLLLSLVGMGVIVERALAFRQWGGTAPGLLRETLTAIQNGRAAEALRACEARQGPVAASLAAILRNRNHPVAEQERAVEETAGEYFLKLEQFLPVLDATTTVSPLLGLLGTIVGMVGTFNAIAGSRGQGNTDAVLSGVGEALYATATGLIVAIITFLAYNFFTARLRTITGETEQAATKLINALAEVDRRSLNGVAPAAAAKEARHAVPSA